jgi:hypothetical protein
VLTCGGLEGGVDVGGGEDPPGSGRHGEPGVVVEDVRYLGLGRGSGRTDTLVSIGTRLRLAQILRPGVGGDRPRRICRRSPPCRDRPNSPAGRPLWARVGRTPAAAAVRADAGLSAPDRGPAPGGGCLLGSTDLSLRDLASSKVLLPVVV